MPPCSKHAPQHGSARTLQCGKSSHHAQPSFCLFTRAHKRCMLACPALSHPKTEALFARVGHLPGTQSMTHFFARSSAAMRAGGGLQERASGSEAGRQAPRRRAAVHHPTSGPMPGGPRATCHDMTCARLQACHGRFAAAGKHGLLLLLTMASRPPRCTCAARRHPPD